MVKLLTFHGSVNYGAAMQGYALYSAVRQLGYECTVIDYNRKTHHRNYLYGGFNVASFKGKLNILLVSLSKKRLDRSFNSFVRRNERLSDISYDGHNRLSTCTWNTDDIYLAGSDQIFNIDMTGGNYHYFLDFTSSPNKFSYASSFGTRSVPDRYREKCAELLAQFRQITVREESGRDIVRELTGVIPEVVLDPVFLLDACEWDKLAVFPAYSGYVLLFMLAFDGRLVSEAYEYASNNGLRLVNIVYTAGNVKEAVNIYSPSPERWLGLFAKASAVFTNSFHGTAFSLVYRKQFTVSLDNLGKASRNSRVTDLLARIGADASLSDINAYIDYNAVGERLEKEREKSIGILSRMLEEGSRHE